MFEMVTCKYNCRPGASAGGLFLCAVATVTSFSDASVAQDFSINTSGTVAGADVRQRYDSAQQFGASTVADNDRTAAKPDGMRVRNYLIFPEVETGVRFDDNVYSQPKNKQSDMRIDVAPSVRFESHLPRHSLNFAFGGRLSRYMNNTALNHNDVYGALDGALHINHAHTLSVRAKSSLTHEDTIAPQAPKNAREKTPVWHSSLDMALERDAGRLHGSIGIGVSRWKFMDVEAFDGTTIEQSGRDLDAINGQLTVGYRFSPGYAVVAQARANRQITGDNASPGGRLAATGIEFLAGITGEAGRLLRWRLLAGYGQRDYDRADLATTSTSLVEGNLEWLVTPLLTVTAHARRGFASAPSALDAEIGSNDRIRTSVGLKADYEIWRNLVLNAGAEYSRSEILQSNEASDLYVGRIGLDYLHTKNWLFSLSFEHQERHFDNSAEDVTRNIVWARAKLRF